MPSIYLVADSATGVGTWHEVADVHEFLRMRYGARLPSGLRIYHGAVGATNDVTPGGSRAEISRGISRLRSLPGPFYAVNHAGGDPLTWLVVGLVVVSVAAGIMLRPKLPNVVSKTQNMASPNNSLSERTNEPRVNGRVPCIVGTVRATPDMLGPSYYIYSDHIRREISYMCISEGTLQIHDMRDDTTPISEIPGATAEIYGPNTSPNSGAPQLRVGDPIGIPLLAAKRIDSVNGQTLIPNDAGAVVRKATRFEYPNRIVSQDSGIDYLATFVPGDVINVSSAAQSAGVVTYSGPAQFFVSNNSANEGTIALPGDRTADWAATQFVTLSNASLSWLTFEGYYVYTNVNGMYEIASVTYEPPNPLDPLDPEANRTVIVLNTADNSSAWQMFLTAGPASGYAIGNPNLSRPSSTILFDLSGSYTIVSVTSGVITLDNPESTNPDWLVMEDDYGGVSDTLYPVISTSGDRWIGWITVQHPREIDRAIMNMKAPGGIFTLDADGEQQRRSVEYRVEAERLDENANPTGDVRSWNRTIVGSALTRAARADTLNVELTGTKSKNWRFRARRLTPSDSGYEGEIVDETIWEDLFVAVAVTEPHFGDITTAYTMTSATEGATAIKQRRFNTLVTRMIPLRVSGDEFTTQLYPTNSAAEILSFLALDPNNGRRTKDQVDFDSIYNAYDDVVTYFGTPLAAEFCYTFDRDTLSFEEIATQVAQAMFCQAYRRGSQLKLYFERQTDHRAMLFDHRNVLPRTEEHSGSFGWANAKSSDGVKFQWVDPETDAIANFILPSDGSANNPLTLESIGVRNHVQAHFHAHREYAKVLYQRRSKTFDALHTANLLIPKNVVLCADGCRPDTVAGEVVAAEGLLVTLDQPVDWSTGTDHHIFLQCTDVSVDSIPITPGPRPDTVILSRAPNTPIVTEGSAINTIYTIISTTNSGTLRPYIVAEKSDKRNMTVGMQVVEYTDKIYLHDKDFINGIIT